MAAGDFRNITLSPDISGAFNGAAGANVVTFTMNATNNAWCGRFVAESTRDIKSVVVSFSAANTPGTVTARIETIDGTSGKPTGTLYDAAATKQFTPIVGTNVITFDVLPTAGLVAGTEYGIVLIKDDAATSCILRARILSNGLPAIALTATDGSTRTNFAEVASSIGIAALIDENDGYFSGGLSPAATNLNFLVYTSDRVVASKIVIATTVTIKAITGIAGGIVSRLGTPAGDLRVRILDDANSVVSGLSFTLDKDSLASANAKGVYIPFDPVTLSPGTYRIAFDSVDSVNSSNCFGMRYADLFDASFQPNGWAFSESANASSTFTWTDYPSRCAPLGLALDDILAGGGGIGKLLGNGLIG